MSSTCRTSDARTLVPCQAGCVVEPGLQAHHDRLLTVETDPDELLDLLELAVTWGELDYSGATLLGPSCWLEFARCHDWQHPERALRVFSLATDMAARSEPPGPVRVPDLAAALVG
jgi:hypothetical protein